MTIWNTDKQEGVIEVEIRNGSNVYVIGKQVAEAKHYRIYLCEQGGTDRECLLQIANEVGQNGKLDRAAYILEELRRWAGEIEEEYAKENPDSKNQLNYALGFPELVDNFVCQEQSGRRINILTFRSVENIELIVPPKYVLQDKLRFDLRTSVWIMGKTLKLLAFIHDCRLSIGISILRNMLIGMDPYRYVIIFDWSNATIHTSDVPTEIRCLEIAQAAQTVITLLGGDPKTGYIPNDGEEAYVEYTGFLARLSNGSESNAHRAHRSFYAIADKYWKREYYPTTLKPL